ncbi:MAG: outer membrane lipoprotein Omp10 [Hoeflea sp.]|uniref:outer membrane lipoprotein Omp10 n=1 Tax=Hoeflea sp. TaxID=1940281 RepID=UPI003EF33994
MNLHRTIAIGALAGLLAACQSPTYSPYSPRPVQMQPRGIEGQWTDPNGIISSFSNGRFETRTTDTNSLLAEGSYRHVSDRIVEIQLTSLLRQTTSQVNCALASQSQLNCTSSSGAQFTLVRRG